MSTPEQPLTRKQRRELERTGALTVPSADSPADSTEQPDPAPDATETSSAPLPRAAEPAAVSPAPIADDEVDLDARPLTRRQARQQERLRTASVPVITEEDAEAARSAAEDAEAEVPASDLDASATDAADSAPVDVVDHETDVDESDAAGSVETDAAESVEDDAAEDDAAEDVEATVADDESHDEGTAPDADEVELDVVADADDVMDTDASVDPDVSDESETADPAPEGDAGLEAEPAPVVDEPVATVGPQFGAALLSNEPEFEVVELPPSFDEIIARNASANTSATPSALILSQAPAVPSISGPIAATGELIVTGSYPLPEGLGSTGVANGAADGHEVDAVLIDGELPAASSPTPIAASAAVSTARGADEIIRPPAPDKGRKLILSLAITAGVLAIAVVTVLIVALANGVFS